MKNLIVYTSEGCHLCELALEQIEQAECFDCCRVIEVDIASDVELLRRFATKVPVVNLVNTTRYLYWPFDQHDLTAWLVSDH